MSHFHIHSLLLILCFHAHSFSSCNFLKKEKADLSRIATQQIRLGCSG
nr:MAG TPA: hypothetical protein [Caudoviricetes sp.]